MFKEQKPNNSKGADKRRTSLNNVVPVQMKELVLNQGKEVMMMLIHFFDENQINDIRVDLFNETVKAGFEKDKDDDDNDDDDDDDEEEELAKNDEEDTETGKNGDEVSESDEEETRQEEEGSFDPIPRKPEGSEEESNDEEDQELMLSEEARIQEEEDADELYCDVNINQGRGLQVTQNVEDSHVTLTLVNLDGPQESSSMSLFVTTVYHPTNDKGRSRGSSDTD
nr:hypothetical protein [Tanacetum cinerariifolium]